MKTNHDPADFCAERNDVIRVSLVITPVVRKSVHCDIFFRRALTETQ